MIRPASVIPCILSCLIVAFCAIPTPAQEADAETVDTELPAEDAAEPSDSESSTALSPVPVTAEEIRQAVESGQYVPFPRTRLPDLSPKEQLPATSQPPPAPTITHASYSAVLDGQSLSRGTLRYRLDAARNADSVILGPTSLRELAFTVNGQPVTSAAMSDGRLSLLTATDALQLEASWSAEGIATADGTRFELQLPPAAVTELTVATDDDIIISSPNATVRPVDTSDGSSRRYTLYPRRSRLLTIVCTQEEAPGATPDSSPVTVNTALSVTEDSIFAEWTLVLPQDLQEERVTFLVDPACRITDIRTEAGNVASWTLSDETPRRLTIDRLRAGQLMTVHGAMNRVRPGLLRLPLLLAPPVLSTASDDSQVPIHPTTVQLLVARSLAVRDLTLRGLYQQEVSFNSTGEQIIELRQFDPSAEGEIRVEPAVASIHQRLLIHRPPETPTLVTVYAELEPRSDQTFSLSWQLSGAWQPTSVDDVTTGLPVHSRLRPADDGSGDTLQIDLRTAASSIQPARLRIQFRSTQAITPETSSLPILINDHYRSLGAWILSSSTSPFQTASEAELIPNTQEELQRVFPWAVDDLPDVGRLQLTRADQLPTSTETPQNTELTIPRATVDYQLQISESLVTEEIRLQLAASDQLPDSMKLLFPEGLNIRLSGREPMEQLRRTGRIVDGRWQEWQLTLPRTAVVRSRHNVSLRISRPVSTAEFAAIPRLPNTSDVTLTARNITDTGTGFDQAELVSESVADTEAQSVILKPAVGVSIQRMTSRLRLRFMRTRAEDNFLGVRGTVRMALSAAEGEHICHSLADLVVSRTGQVESMMVHWPEAYDIQVLVNDQPLSCPPGPSGTQILLPPDEATTCVRVLWKSSVHTPGLLSRMSTVRLPEFVSAQRVELAHLLQIQPGDARLLVGDTRTTGKSTDAAPLASTVDSEDPFIRSFMMRWQLAQQHGAARQLISAEDGRISFVRNSGRQAVAWGMLVFCAVIFGGQLLPRQKTRTLMSLLLLGSAAAMWAGPTLVWSCYGWNAALCLLLIVRACWQPLVDWWNDVEPAEALPPESAVSSAAVALAAILLTGQAPANPAPPVLVNESMEDSSPIVFVRRDLIGDQSTVSDSDLRVRDVSAHVRLEQEGGTEITVEATVASRRSEAGIAFTVPVETATLTECALDDEPVSPVRGADGRPQIRLPPSEETAATATGSNAGVWQLSRIRYTLRSDAGTTSGRIDIRVPLPWSARTRLSVDSVDDPILSARLTNGPDGTRESDVLTFPLQYNRGPLDIQLVTQRSQSAAAARNWNTEVICRARLLADRTVLTCRYQLNTPQLLPEELQLPVVPGYQPGPAVTPDSQPLETTLTDEYLTVSGTRQQLNDFEITWESLPIRMNTIHRVPLAALTPPASCRSARTLLAVDVAEPFAVAEAGLADLILTAVSLSREELNSLGISPSARCFEISDPATDVRLQLELQTTRRVASQVEQSLVVGVQTLAWSCQCDLEVTGPPAFRQRIQVPRHLLIDDVTVSGNRMRSWSVGDGSLLVTFREGTRGSVQLSVRGVLQIPRDGRINVLPVQLEGTEVVESSFLVSSTRDAAAQVDDASGTDPSNPIASGPFSLNPYPVRLPIVDAAKPIQLSTRTQEQTTARILVLTHTNTPIPHSDIVLRLQAGDQSWDGRIRLPDELSEVTVDWVAGEQTTALFVEGGELPPRRVAAGEAAYLVIRGVATPTESSDRRLPLPVLEPEVRIDQVRQYGRQTGTGLSDQATLPWMLKTLDNSDVTLAPSGVTERGRAEHYDARDNTIYITGLQSSASLPNSVVRRAAHSVGVTSVHTANGSLTGITDLLIDFGDADESRCSIPANFDIISCQLDGVDLPETASTGFISLRRRAQVQRLRLTWVKPLPDPSYLPRQSQLDLPTVDALDHRHFVTLDAAARQSWSGNDSLVAITPAQLDTRIAAALSATTASTNSGADDGADTAETVARYISDQQNEARQTEQLFEAADTGAASLRYRQHLPWARWIPVMALGAVWLTVTGRQASLRRRTQRSSRSVSGDLSDHADEGSSISSDSTPSTST